MWRIVSPPPSDHIRAQLDKLLESQPFAGAERLRRFLKFIVDHSLEFPTKPLKEIIIGTELYASNGDFDPRLSAVVRVDATRLRAKLREYYASEGAADPLTINLPKGSYTPVFREVPAPSDPGEHGSTEKTMPSIAVLPFSNLSPQTGDFFSDGLTEEIIHALSAIEGVRVVARASCFAMKHRNADIREIGRTLNVNLVLEGSVRIAGDQLRATVQLVNTANGYQIWSRRYDRRLNDVFAVQDEIAHEIVNSLRVSTANRLTRQATRNPVDVEAYTWYLRGRHHLRLQTRASFHRAIECFERALDRCSQYSAALSGIGVAWLYLGLFAMDIPLEALPKAREAATRALDVDERDGEGLSVVACTKGMYEWDWTGAETLFRRALEVEPGSELCKHLFAMFSLLPMARFEESLAMIDEARRIDPLSTFVSSSKAAIFLVSRRVAEAEAECRRALELDPDFWRSIVVLGRCYETQGRYEDAIACYERATVLSDRVPSAIGALGRACALAGRHEEACALLRELDELARHRYVSPWAKVLIYLGLADDKVFECLEQTCRDRGGWLMYLAADPRFDPLRADPRFRSILERLHLKPFAVTLANVSPSA
jgi:TolB-like protein